MNKCLPPINRWLRRQARVPLTLGTLLVAAALGATTVRADMVDGRYVPEWTSGKILLPDLVMGSNTYRAELALSTDKPLVLSVAELRQVAGAPPVNVLDSSASIGKDNVLTIPVFKSNDRYFAAELEPVGAGSTPSTYRVKHMWHVQPGKLDVPIGGLDYVAGTKSSVTDSQGRFYRIAGEATKFSIAGMDLGTLQAAHVARSARFAALFELGEKDQRYRRSLQVLGLLDIDANSVNGIAIPPAVKTAVAASLRSTSLGSLYFDSEYAALAVAVRAANPAALSLAAVQAEIEFQKLEIQSYLIARLAEKSIPGVSLSIELPTGELWHTAAGLANTATREPMTSRHQFRVGSITKSFTAMLIMQLVDEGKLTLEQTLDSFFPGVFPGGNKITVKMLLNHTAGLFSFTDEFPGFDEVYGVTLDSPPQITDLWFVRYIGMPGFVYAPGELVDIGSEVHKSFAGNNATEKRPWLINEPGKVWNYSNTHYLVLQEIAEMLTKKRWEDEISRRFLVPLGMTDTRAPSAGDLLMRGTYAHGYINWADNQGEFVADLFGLPNADVDRSNTDPSFTMGSGALISTTRDLVIWANAVMEGRLLSPKTQALMREPFTVNSAFGAKINMLQGVVQDLSVPAFGHRGQIAGYDASWQYRYGNAADVTGTGTAMSVIINRTLLMESNADGSVRISNVDEVMLKGVLEILYGSN